MYYPTAKFVINFTFYINKKVTTKSLILINNLKNFLVNGIDESSNDSNHSVGWCDRSNSPSPIPNDKNLRGK